MWGKLQIMGLGTAIKILLLSPEQIHSKAQAPQQVLTRQEVIALVNSLHQLAKSVHFAVRASDLEFSEKIRDIEEYTLHYSLGGLLVLLGVLGIHTGVRRCLRTRKVLREK